MLVFVAAIAVGTGLLLLPWSTAPGRSTDARDRAVHVHQRHLRHRPGGGGHRDPLERVRSGGPDGAGPARRPRVHDHGLADRDDRVEAPRVADGTDHQPRAQHAELRRRAPRAVGRCRRDLHHRGGGGRAPCRALPCHLRLRLAPRRLVRDLPRRDRLQQRRLRPLCRLARGIRDRRGGDRPDLVGRHRRWPRIPRAGGPLRASATSSAAVALAHPALAADHRDLRLPAGAGHGRAGRRRVAEPGHHGLRRNPRQGRAVVLRFGHPPNRGVQLDRCRAP